MALGAQASNIRNMVIRQGMLLAGIGLVIGIAGAFWLTKFLTGFLFGVKNVGSDGLHSDANRFVRSGTRSSLGASQKSDPGRSDFSAPV